MKRLLLVDLSGIFWREYHASADQELSAAFEKTITKVRGLREGFDYCVLCVDSPPYARLSISPEYKQNREAHPPQALEQFERTKHRLTLDGCLLWAEPGTEADDVIASAVNRAVLEGVAVTIATSDKDLYALIDDRNHVEVLSLGTGAMVNEAGCIEKFGVAPLLVPDLLALWGDTSDNIRGVPGVGVKTAAKLLEKHGPTIDDLLANIEDITSDRIRDAVRASVDTIRLAYKLVQLRMDVPIKWEELFEERQPQRLTEEPIMSDFEEEEPAQPVAPDVPLPSPKADALAVTNPNNGNGHSLVTFEQELQPRSINGAYTLAKGLHESRLYAKFPNAEAIWAVIIRGREMGLGALTALESFHVIEGKPAASAHLLIARAKGHPDCEYFQYVGGDATFAEYETKNRRSPRPTRLKYTIEQAKRAGLARNGSNWEKRPEEMLRKTAAVQLARIEYPEVLQGAYAVEELGT